jgi:chaperone required for assembly of F1-ATPase
MPVKQDAGTVPGFARHLEQLDDWRLTAASHAVSISGSIVLGLALVMGKRDAEAVYTASLLDELYQAERWGSDAEADARRAHIRRELQTVETFLSLLQA